MARSLFPIVLVASIAGTAGAGDPSGPVLSEVYYHPPAGQPGTEFIELMDPGTAPLDLSGFRFTKGIELELPGHDASPGGRLVVAQDPAALQAAFGKVAAVGPWRGRLGEGTDHIRLEDVAGSLAVDLRYGDFPPWPGSGPEGGLSISRVHLRLDGDDPAAWTAAKPSPGGPPPAAPPEPAVTVHAVSHQPRGPRPGEEVKVTAAVRGPAGVEAVVRWQADGGRSGAAPLEPAGRSCPGGSDPLRTAVIPGAPADAVVRYWVEVRAGADLARSPPRGAPSRMHGFHVEPARREGALPVYGVRMDARSAQSMERSAFSNQLWPATFISGPEVWDVQVRHRGAWARTWPKKPWKVFFPKDHLFGKEHSLNLNSGWRDPAIIREVLAYEVYRRSGAVSFRCQPVRLDLNGAFHGVYIEVENASGEALRRNGLAGGWLYKAASRSNMADERAFSSPEDYEGQYTRESKDCPGFEELHRFCRGIAEAPDAKAFFERELDMPHALAYFCASAFLQNWDGFNKNHFLAFDVRGSRKWTPVPWDLDRTLGDVSQVSFDGYQLPLICGTSRSPYVTGWNRLLDRFLGDPRLYKTFAERLRQLLTAELTEEKLFPVLDRLAASLGEDADLDRRRWGGDPDWREGIEGVKRYIRRRREFLLTQLPGGEPRAPEGRSPAPGSVAAGDPVVLEGSPFAHEEPAVRHRSTRWQVTVEGGSWSEPVVDIDTTRDLERLAVPRGVLLPRTTYLWRLAHTGTNGKTSEASAESRFVTPDFPFAAVPFDLSRRFNKDVVAAPGDRRQDPIDNLGGLLVVDGFDGTPSPNPRARGLPRDRRLGVHVLGDYTRPNSVQLTSRDRAAVRVEAPAARYSFVRFLVAGGEDSTMPVVFEYQEGAEGEASIPCDDWYDDEPPEGPPGSVRPPAVPLRNGMGRIRNGSFVERNDPAVFEVGLPVDAGRTLVAFRLEPARADFGPRRTARFNLLAATGIRLDAGGRSGPDGDRPPADVKAKPAPRARRP